MNRPVNEPALAWLVEHAHENLGTEIVLRGASADRARDVALARGLDGSLTGVSVWSPGGQWFLEAESAGATAELVADVAAHAGPGGRWPAPEPAPHGAGAVDNGVRNWFAGWVSDFHIERITDTEAAAIVDPLFREYGLWAAGQVLAHHGLRFSEADLERHHAAFRAEVPGLVGPRGRLLLARIGDQPIGVGTLKPVDDATGEIKRMYVRPAGRGHGVGRALLEQLVAGARADGNVVVRLETLDFMKDAHTLYRSLGFVDTTIFDGSEAVAAGFESFTYYLELKL